MSDKYMWSRRDRIFENAIIKRELALGDRGSLTYRWAEFMTGDSILRTILFFPGVVVPLVSHRLALRRAASTLGLTQGGETVIRFTVHGSSALLFLDDMQPKITQPFLLSVAHSAPDWSFEIKAPESGALSAIVVRVLNRALSKFQSGQTAIRVREGAMQEFLPEEAR